MHLIASIAMIHLIACLSPGPDIFLVVLNSLRQGHRCGMATTIGILCGVTIQISVGIAGISLLLQQGSGLHAVMAIAGSLWLVYLGYRGVARHPAPSGLTGASPADSPTPGSLLLAVRDGFLVNILNPKALLYFLGLFSVMLGPDVPLALRLACGGTMLAVQAAAFSSVAILIDQPGFKRRWQPLQHVLEWTLSIILLILGTSICLTTLYSLIS